MRNVFWSRSCLLPACTAWTLPLSIQSGFMTKRNAEHRLVRETYWNEVCVLNH
ncbi:MAG: hypothetical protein ACRCT4_14705 [Silvania sp.]